MCLPVNQLSSVSLSDKVSNSMQDMVQSNSDPGLPTGQALLKPMSIWLDFSTRRVLSPPPPPAFSPQFSNHITKPDALHVNCLTTGLQVKSLISCTLLADGKRLCPSLLTCVSSKHSTSRCCCAVLSSLPDYRFLCNMQALMKCMTWELLSSSTGPRAAPKTFLRLLVCTPLL